MLAGCGGSATTPEPEGQTLSGTVTLHSERRWTGDTCRGGDGYDDIRSGMSVTLRDGEGSVIGTTSLSVGRTEEPRTCIFEFAFTDVPEAEFYAIEAGRRGELTYSAEDLEEQSWTVGLEIGP